MKTKRHAKTKLKRPTPVRVQPLVMPLQEWRVLRENEKIRIGDAVTLNRSVSHTPPKFIREPVYENSDGFIRLKKPEGSWIGIKVSESNYKVIRRTNKRHNDKVSEPRQ